MAVALAPLALSGTGLFNLATASKDVTITIDPTGADRIRAQLTGVSSLAILIKSNSAIGFADVYEKAGRQASIITDLGDPSAMSISQARTAMAASCKPGIDASLYGRIGNVDVSKMSMFIGRADTKIDGDLYIYNCKLKKLDSAPVLLAFNAMGMDGGQAEKVVGGAMALKVLEVTK